MINMTNTPPVSNNSCSKICLETWEVGTLILDNCFKHWFRPTCLIKPETSYLQEKPRPRLVVGKKGLKFDFYPCCIDKITKNLGTFRGLRHIYIYIHTCGRSPNGSFLVILGVILDIVGVPANFV